MPFDSFSAPARAATTVYAWGCVVHNNLHFTYVYGPQAEFGRLAGLVRAGDFLLKGHGPTLEGCREQARVAAEALAPVYDGIGTVRTAPVSTYTGPGFVG